MNSVKPKKIRKRLSLKGELFASSISLMIIFAACLLSVFLTTYNNNVESVYLNQIASTSEETINNFSIYVDNLISFSNSIEKKIDVSELTVDSDYNSSYFDELVSLSSDIRFVALYDETGNLEAKNSSYHASESKDVVVNSSWFSSAQRDPMVTSFSKIEEGSYFTLSKYIKSSSKGPFVLRIEYNFKQILSLIEGANLGEGGHILIYNKSYDVVYSSKEKISNEEWAEIKEMVIGEKLFSEEGINYYFYLSTIPSTTWRILIANNCNNIVSTKRTVITLTTVSSSIFVVLFIFVIYLVTNHLTKPLIELEEEMAKLESFDFQVSSLKQLEGTKEIETLNKTYLKMLSRIQDLAKKLLLEEKAQNKAELEALQNQINPHFLYNTLDSIIYMIDQGKNEEASKMIIALSRFFRISISKGKNIIPLEKELEHVRYYLQIQKMRYKDNFSFSINYRKEEIASFFIIKLILQPLVENALLHGIGEEGTKEAKIEVNAKVDDRYLLLEVIDNGYGMLEDKVEEIKESFLDKKIHKGVGLSNVYQRIKLYYGPSSDLEISSELDKGTKISIFIPIKELKNEEK